MGLDSSQAFDNAIELLSVYILGGDKDRAPLDEWQTKRGGAYVIWERRACVGCP